MVRARSVLATAMAVAYVSCPLVEPLPDGPAPAEPWWLVALGLASIASIVVAVAAVASAARRAGRLTLLAGAGMVAMTVSCPASGHHVTGWWTYWQAGMTAFVLLAGAALVVRPLRRDDWAALPHPAAPVPPVATPVAPPSPDVVARAPRRAERPSPVRPETARPAAGPARTPERTPAGRRVAR